MFDSHCHINDSLLFESRKEVFERARENHIKGVLCVGWDLESSLCAIAIAHEFENCYAAVGIHPENLDGVNEEDLEKIEEIAHDEKVVAIGEIGLDYHWVKDPLLRERQKEYFIRQIEIANKLSLPVTIHAREALQDTYDILSKRPIDKNFSLHCYSGSLEMMKAFSKRFDCYFGFDGPVTFKNALSPKENAAFCPIDRLLLETDSPYLTPTPFRGKTNEPSYLVYVGQEIAKLRAIDISKLSEQTDKNVSRLFHVEL